jgi:hypothetical protein
MNASTTNGIRPGLVSVTFRQLPVERVVALASGAGLVAIEWGGDVHVPHGELTAARRARRLCEDVGIEITAYGSYYCADGSGSGHEPFTAVLETALELGARTIRVWAGRHDSREADTDMRRRIRDDLANACDLAAAQGSRVALEYHAGTLTDTAPSTLALLQAVGRPNLCSYWQPTPTGPPERGVHELWMLQPHLGDLHVFHWWPDHETRLPLAAGVAHWHSYLRAASADGRPRVAALEFVRGDDEAQLAADATTLHSLLDDVSGQAKAEG